MKLFLKTSSLVFVGGSIGAALRFLLALEFETGPMLMIVNGLGTLLLGFINGRTWSAWVQPFWGTGVAGGFTTLSGVSLFIAANLAAEPLSTIAPVTLMLALGFASYWVGLKAARLLK